MTSFRVYTELYGETVPSLLSYHEMLVKTDVASLYPSLMRTFKIGPACDRLGVPLHILDRLTELRLHHKVAARQAPPGSMEANQHDGTQAAMKTLINSAYGYMGAGSMALFADPIAANEVTRRGRALLDQLLDALRERGMALIEADTDGVHFAVPADWTEAQERALVAEIGTLLPAGIRLEYKGRYRAMLSHAIKNYALLTYDEQLIVRGVALRSSRAEPLPASIPPHNHLKPILWSQTYSWLRYNVLSWYQFKGDALSQGCEEQVSFHHGKVVADTDARTCAEW